MRLGPRASNGSWCGFAAERHREVAALDRYGVRRPPKQDARATSPRDVRVGRNTRERTRLRVAVSPSLGGQLGTDCPEPHPIPVTDRERVKRCGERYKAADAVPGGSAESPSARFRMRRVRQVARLPQLHAAKHLGVPGLPNQSEHLNVGLVPSVKRYGVPDKPANARGRQNSTEDPATWRSTSDVFDCPCWAGAVRR